MKPRPAIRNTLIVCIVLLCAGFVLYSFGALDRAEKRERFDLYELVPQDVVAVFDTDRMSEVVRTVDLMACSENEHNLRVSALFAYVRKYLDTLIQEMPHGLSREMNEVLISFHRPDTFWNQVMYCKLAPGDREMLSTFGQKLSSSPYSPKDFDYKGYTLTIYPLPGGHFLSVWMTRNFLVVSFQKYLVEQAIEAYQEKKALLQLPAFREIYQKERTDIGATLYLNMDKAETDLTPNIVSGRTRLENWMEFDMKLEPDAVYCSGVSYEKDSTGTFLDAMRAQEPIESFSMSHIPASTFFYTRWAIEGVHPLFNRKALTDTLGIAEASQVRHNNVLLMDYLERNAGKSLMSCMFLPEDTLHTTPHRLLRLELKDIYYAEWELKKWLGGTGKTFVLPSNSVLPHAFGETPEASPAYAYFYRGALLLAPDKLSLETYINMLEQGYSLAITPAYGKLAESLSPSCNFLQMADMEEVMRYQGTYTHSIPKFFFTHASFFRHFLCGIQIVCTDKRVYPNLTFLYKPAINSHLQITKEE